MVPALERLGLRQRFALFFAALALGGGALFCAGLWLGWSRSGGAPGGYVIAGIVGVLGLAGFTAWIALLFDENVAKPILTLSSELSTRASADIGGKPIAETEARYLGTLAPDSNALVATLEKTRRARSRAIAAETQRIEREKTMFAALMRDLAEGVVVVTNDRRIMLYNHAAKALLPGLGLDRSLPALLRPGPLDQAYDRLAARMDRGDTAPEAFLVADAEGARFLLGQIAPIAFDDTPEGGDLATKSRRSGDCAHVLILGDATDDLEAHAERDHLFNRLMEEVRRPASAMGAILELLLEGEQFDAATRGTFDAALKQELDRLYGTLRALETRHEAATTRHWPMARVADGDIFDALQALGITPLTLSPAGLFAECDSYAVLAMLANVLRGMTAEPGRTDFAARAETRGDETWMILSWTGAAVPDGQLQEWLAQPLTEDYRGYTGRDALTGHRTEIWAEREGDGHRIVLPLRAVDPPKRLPAEQRPEFYDFNLPLPSDAGDMGLRPLRELSFVVFDTETTGLEPRGGDEIVQIAGLRIVNGRILSGEVFDTLVNPNRPIPAASTAVHGISEDMVRDAPDIAVAGQAFHDFCAGSVLVAHNAPFDMAFLQEREATIGRSFDMPTLCTVLLSAAMFDHTGSHTLDALAERLGVTLPEVVRHTAIGDARATAEVFMHLIELLEHDGVVTLNDALAASQRQTHIRRAQNY